jgi:GNAT superfamily N-acetyltransferase
LIELVTTYLEMHAAPPKPCPELDVRYIEKPSVSYFRYLYNTTTDGKNGFWWVRRQMSDAALEAIITRPGAMLFILYDGGNPAGFYELDLYDPAQIEISFFGILLGFQGRRFGQKLLAHALQNAWERGPERVWLHTCNFDSPAALGNYIKGGFAVYAEEREWIELPAA